MQAVKNLIAVSPQETSVAPKLTVRENLTFFAEIYGYKGKAAQERVEEIISQWEFAEVANKQACTLSGGWQRRLSVAIALIGNPKVIFLDEPTLGLDVLARRQLWSSIKSLKGKMTIIITSHYLEEIEYLCDSLAIMSKGKVLAQGTVDEIKALAHADNLEDAFINIAEGEGGKYHEA
jgi:ABC-2 type transport system ATP-binding protein